MSKYLLIFHIFLILCYGAKADSGNSVQTVRSASIDSAYHQYEKWVEQRHWENGALKALEELRLNPIFSSSVSSTAEAFYHRSVRSKSLSMQASCLYLRCLIADRTYSDLPTITQLAKEAYRIMATLSPCDEINMRRLIAEIFGNPKYKKQNESFSIIQQLKVEAYERKCWTSLVALYMNESDLLSANYLDVQESLILKLEAVDIAKKYLPNSQSHAFAISECGKAYFHAYALKEAVSYWKSALAIYEKLVGDYHSDLIRLNNDLGLAYFDLKKVDSSSYYFDLAYQIAEKHQVELWKGIIKGNKGKLLVLQGKVEEAKKFLKNDFEISLRANEVESSSATALHLAYILVNENNLKEAETYLDTAKLLLNRVLLEKPYSSSFGVNRSWLEYYRLLGLFYHRNKQFQKSSEAYQTFAVFNDSLNGAQKYRELALKATLQHNLKSEISTRKLKETQNKILVKQSAYKTRMLVTLIAMLLICACFAFLLYRSREDLKVALQNLQNQKEKIENQSESLKLITLDLRKSNEALSKLNHLKDKLFSLVAHDLRAPLNTVKGVLSLFKEGDINEESLRSFMPKIEENVGDTLNMLDNLLNWAKSQLDGFKVKPQQFDLKELIDQNFKLFYAEAKRKDVLLINNLHATLVAYADKEMINLVLRNIIHNAIKFTQPGDRVVTDGASFADEVVIKISDTGVGMSDEQLQNLTSKKMVSTLGTANEKGTGLGLQLCFDFVHMNHGRIEVHSRKSQGSVFSINLPVSQA